MENKADRKTMIGWGISISIPAFIACIPVSDIFSGSLKLFFVITFFVIFIFAFELLPNVIAAVLLPCLYMVTELVPVETAFASWTSRTVWMVIGGLLLSNMLEDCGLLKRISCFVIKKCGRTFKGVVFGSFIIGIILNLVTFCNGWLIGSVLIYGICKNMELKCSKESAIVCLAGIMGASGSEICLYNPVYFSMVESALTEFAPGYRMTLKSAFQYNGWFLLWCMLVFIIVMKVYKVKDYKMKGYSSYKECFEKRYATLGTMSKKEKKAVVMLVILLIYLNCSRFIGLPESYGFIILPLLMFMPGIRLGNEDTIKRLNFSTVFFVATCMGIGIVGSAIGFDDLLTTIALPILEGKGMLFVCLVLLAMGMIGNLFMTPFAMLGGLAIPFAHIAVSLGINPVAAVMLLIYSSEMVFFPYESSGYLIMYQYGMIPMKEFIKQMTLRTIIMYLGFVIVIYPMWKLTGLL